MTLEAEIAAVEGLTPQSRSRLLLLARRDLISISPELRLLFWLAVSMLVGGVGTLLAKNVEKIGHGVLIATIAIAAAACYAFAWRQRGERGGVAEEPADRPIADYVLLLGALLLSADVGYAESQYRFFGDAWRWHLLILAVIHAVTAYLFASRLLLSLAIVGLAGFLGVDRNGEIFSRGPEDAAARLTLAGAVIALWRILHERFVSEGSRSIPAPEDEEPPKPRRLESFEFPLEQAAYHLAMFGALAAIASRDLRWIGLLAALLLAILGGAHAVRSRRESFLFFGILYAVLALNCAFLPTVVSPFGWLGLITFSSMAAIAALYFLHMQWKERFR